MTGEEGERRKGERKEVRGCKQQQQQQRQQQIQV